MLRKTKGIVLRQYKFSDNKRIVNVFTKTSGKKAFIVYYSAKTKKTKINLFQPFFILNLEFDEKENKNVGYIKEVSIDIPFKTIPYSPEKTAIVFFLVEVLSKIIEEDYTDEKFFDFLESAILLLDKKEKIANFHLSFLATMSIYIGIMPKSNYSSENKFFDLREGVFSSKFQNQYSMDAFISSKFNDILKTGIENSDEVKLVQSDRKILLKKILDFYTFHYSHLQNLKSLEVLAQVFNES